MTVDAKTEQASNLIALVMAHVETTLHLKPKRMARAVVNANLSEFGLAESYSAEVMEIGGRKCVVLIALQPPTPSRAAKDIALVERRMKTPVFVATPRMTSSARDQYVRLAAPFVVPGNQVYLPFLGIDLRETFRPPVNVRRGGVSPVAQVVLFTCAYGGFAQITPSGLANKTGYSVMSLVRACDELAAHGVGRVEKRGREKVLSFKHSPRETIEAARELLSKPYRGVYGVRFSKPKPRLLKAGEIALAAWTGVESQDLPTFAIPSPGWQEFFQANGIERSTDLEDADAIIETWRYDPAILARRGRVDPLSLYAQYWADPNPRLAQAAEALLQEIPG